MALGHTRRSSRAAHLALALGLGAALAGCNGSVDMPKLGYNGVVQRGYQLDDRLHPHRPRIAVRRQHAGVDDQHAEADVAVGGERRRLAVGAVASELDRPLAREGLAGDDLVTFDAGGEVRRL